MAASCLAVAGVLCSVLSPGAGGSQAAGVVALVADGSGRARWEVSGYRDLASRAPMRRDTIFQIMSMTKPVTAVAVMMLADEGRLDLDDRAARFLPEFAGRAITIRQLLTHTSGVVAEDPKQVPDDRAKQALTLAEFVRLVAAAPLAFPPGTHYRYSGPGYAVLGRIVETVSGVPFQDFLAHRIFEPLGMRDTFFFPPAGVRSRIATVYEVQDGRFRAADADLYRTGAVYANPAGGLFSTARDMERLLRMMLNGGALGGNRILSFAAAAEMLAPQAAPQPEGPCARRFGLGWQLPPADPGCSTQPGPGWFAHAGAYGTYMCAEPSTRRAGVFLMQRIGGGDAERAAFFDRFARGGRRAGRLPAAR